MKIKTITEDNIEVEEVDFEFDYQPFLTEKLDNMNSDFDQNLLNEIVLWKVSRYAHFDDETIAELNRINRNHLTISTEIKKALLRMLLKINGVSLPMASTILRFKNNNVFQIIDQRVYRLIYGKPLKVYNRTEKNIEDAIEIYLNYLDKLYDISAQKGVPFFQSDRVFYKMDIRLNGDIKIH